jgi:hypothetical protein
MGMIVPFDTSKNGMKILGNKKPGLSRPGQHLISQQLMVVNCGMFAARGDWNRNSCYDDSCCVRYVK